MSEERTVIAIQEYGHVKLCLGEYMEKLGLNRNSLCSKTGIRFEVIDRWSKGKVERMDLDVLARICYVLDCSVADILKYEN